MTWEHLSKNDIDTYITLPKRITISIESAPQWSYKHGHRQLTYRAVARDGTEYIVYRRENIKDKKDFSCGLKLIDRNGKKLCLVRYNGSNHKHGDIEYQCHIHIATREAIQAGKNPENYAKETNRYSNSDEAFTCLMRDCHILKENENGLFKGI